MALEQYYGTGRRKTAVARVFLRPGEGKIVVNGKEFQSTSVAYSARFRRSRPSVRPAPPAATTP